MNAKLLPLLLGTSLLLAGCCSGPRARAERYAGLNQAHADDQALPRQAREIAQDNADAWAVQAWHLGGDEPSAEAQARVDGGER